MNRTLSGTLFSLASAAGYASLALWVKWSYHEGLEALDILTWRYIFGSILVWSLWPLIRDSAALNTLNRRQVLTLIGLGALFVWISLMAVMALNRIPATTYTLILYTYPALVAIFSFFLGERLPLGAWFSVGLALVGCALTAGGQLDVNKPMDIFFPFANAAFYAVYLIIAGRYTRKIPGTASGIISLTSSAFVLLPLITVRGLQTPNSLNGWVVLVCLATISTVLPILTMFAGIARIGASNAAIVSTIEPLITITLAALILREKASTMQYLGGVLILISVVLLQVIMRKQTTSQSAGA
ncbi:MAG: DMT family transporter [Chloroflexi bacterium]|nr:DMT family transporter [Chloroflexota bacterium]